MRLHLIYCPGFHLVFSHYELIMHDLGSELFHHLTVVDTDVHNGLARHGSYYVPSSVNTMVRGYRELHRNIGTAHDEPMS